MRFRLDCAAEWYWLAETPDQARCAYYEMLLAGGEDGYAYELLHPSPLSGHGWSFGGRRTDVRACLHLTGRFPTR